MPNSPATIKKHFATYSQEVRYKVMMELPSRATRFIYVYKLPPVILYKSDTAII